MNRVPLWLAVSLLLASPVAADEVGFIEDFALARDRAAALRQLIPGTEDYYYYHALHYLNTEQYDKAEALTRPWHDRLGQTPRLTEIQTRSALLTYARDPRRSLDYLRNRLGLRFDHQKVTPGVAGHGRGGWPPARGTAVGGLATLSLTQYRAARARPVGLRLRPRPSSYLRSLQSLAPIPSSDRYRPRS